MPAEPLFTRIARRLTGLWEEIRDRLEWMAARRFLGRPPWSTNRLGQRFQALCFNDYRYLRNGNPEIRESLLLGRLARPGFNIVDVGANHGCFCMEASRFVGPSGRVHAFEPTPRTRLRLEWHLRLNGLDNVKVFPAALGAICGSGRLRVHHEATGLNSLAPANIVWQGSVLAADEVIDVPLSTLDAHAASEGLERIDFLKVDVEGFESAVFQGARGLLAARRIGWIMYEIYESTSANAGVSPLGVIAELEAFGYQTYEITRDGKIGARVVAPMAFLGGNYVAFHRDARPND